MVGEAVINVTEFTQQQISFPPYLISTNRPNTFPVQRLTDYLNPDVLNDNGQSGLLTVNKTIWTLPFYMTPDNTQNIIRTGTCDAPGAYFPEQRSYERNLANPSTHAFWATILPSTTMVTERVSTSTTFEDLATYSTGIRVATLYDVTPPTIRQGSVWHKCPAQATWNSLTPTGQFRNLKGKPTAMAYREKPKDPLNYMMFSYDERGRLEAQIRFTDNIGWDAVYYKYNSMNKVISVTVADAERQHTTWYGYDNAGRLDTTWSKLGSPGTGLFQNLIYANVWAYPTPLQCTRKNSNNNIEVVQDYTPREMVLNMRYPSINTNTEYTYNSRGWVTSSDVIRNGSNTIFHQNYQYRLDGNILGLNWQRATNDTYDMAFSYDDNLRLKTWNYRVNNMTQMGELLEYDKIGNRTSVRRTGTTQDPYQLTSLGSSYQTGTSRLLEYHTQNYSNNIPQNTALKHKFTYNSDGSLNTRYRVEREELGSTASYRHVSEEFNYTYNGLISEYISNISQSGGSAEECFDNSTSTHLKWKYRYSPSGEREQKRLVEIPTTVVPGYNIYSLNRSYYLVGSGSRQHAIYEGRENTFAAPCSLTALTGRAVIWSPSEYLMYAGGSNSLVTFLPNGNKEYKLLDHLGNTRTILDQNGGIIAEHDYEPFGKKISSTILTNSGTVPRQGFIGKELDSESDLADHGVRKYDYITGRFMATDPLWENYREFNTYQYGGNIPLQIKDPTGLELEWIGTEEEKLRAQELYQQVIDYLIQNGDEKSAQILIQVRDDKSFKIPFVLTQYDEDCDHTWPSPDDGHTRFAGSGGIHWDPRMGMIVENAILPPAVSLVHEADHALQYGTKRAEYRRLSGIKSEQWEDKEEYRTSNGYNSAEARAADCLGLKFDANEPHRTSREGTWIFTPSIFSTQIIYLPKQ